jgi:deazaflavin-dependent oxidoreductase (nitroreductase family)
MPRFDDIPKDINQHIAAHIKLYLEDPEKAHMWDSSVVGVPGPVTTLLLTTTGRKSGEERHVPLLYVDNDGTYLVVGSKGGHPSDPIWYLNLQAEPRCEIRVGRFRSKAVARTLEGEERARLWKKVTDRHDVYKKYQARTDRQIPLVLLEPVTS